MVPPTLKFEYPAVRMSLLTVMPLAQVVGLVESFVPEQFASSVEKEVVWIIPTEA